MNINWGVFSGDLVALIIGLVSYLFFKEAPMLIIVLVYAVCMLVWHLEPFAKLNDFAGLV